MNTPLRTFVKAITWQLIGLVSMSLIGFAFTGSVTTGSGIALAGMAVGFVIYVVHERIWDRIHWGQQR